MQAIDRRQWLGGAAAGAAALVGAAARGGQPARVPALDTHVHFYDPTRPQGVPWPPRDDRLLYRRVLPEHLKPLAQPLGVRGVIVVEASRWIEDNQWLLDLAAGEPFIRGVVGALRPGADDFARLLRRFARNPRFRGVRVRGGELAAAAVDRRAAADFRRLADAGLTLDVVGGPPMLAAALTVSRRVPALRVVLDHLPFDWPEEGERRRAAQDALAELAAQPNVYAKVSHVLRRPGGRLVEDLEAYRAKLDWIWRRFGADRVLFGSNWPVCERIAPYDAVYRLVARYLAGRPRAEREPYFWRNAAAAYELPEPVLP